MVKLNLMKKKTITITVWTCLKCGADFTPRGKTPPRSDGRPRCCGKCKSPYWDVPSSK
jgi:hypothetical protein